MTCLTLWSLRRAAPRSRSQTVMVAVKYPNETRSSPSSWSAASASAALLAAALSTRALSCLVASSFSIVSRPLRFAHHRLRYFSISTLAASRSRQMYLVTQRYSTGRWFESSSRPGTDVPGNPTMQQVGKKYSPNMGTSPGVSAMSGRSASRYMGVSGTETVCRFVETQLCR